MRKIIVVIAVLWSAVAGAQKDLPYKAIAEAGNRISVNDSTSQGKDSLKMLTSRAVYDDLQNVYDTRGKFLNVARKLLTGSSQSGLNTSRGDAYLSFGWIGDSMSGYIASPFYNMLKDLLGFGGGNMESVAVTGGGSTHQNVAETQYWFNGTWYEINGTGSLTFTYAGGRIPATILKVYYIQEPGAGTFQVQVDNGSGFANEGSVVDCNGTLAGKVISIPKAQGQYSIRINQVSGNVKVIMTAGINRPTNRDAVMLWRMGVGGLQWTNANATSKAITSPIFADMGIDLAMIQIKEDGDVYPDLKGWLDAFRLASPNTDWCLNGSGPETSNDFVNRATNRAMKKIALEDTLFYFDGYRPLISMARVDSLNWEGDGVHLDNATGHYLASMLWRVIGIEDYYAIGRKLGVDKNGNLKMLNSRAIGFETNNNDGTIAAYIDANFTDFRVRTSRWFNISNIGGTIQSYYDPNAGWKQSANVNTRGYTFDITNAPGMYMPNDSTIAMFRNRGAGTRMHFWGQDGNFLGNINVTGDYFKAGAPPAYVSGGYDPLVRNTTTGRFETTVLSLGVTTINTTTATLSLSLPASGVGSYIYSGSSNATWTLPAVAASGTQIDVQSVVAYGFTINANAGASDITIFSGNVSTTKLPGYSITRFRSDGSKWIMGEVDDGTSEKISNFIGNSTVSSNVRGFRYSFSGPSGANLDVAASPFLTRYSFVVKNRGTGDVIVSAGGGSIFYDLSAVSSVTIGVGGSRTFTWNQAAGLYEVD